MRPKLSETYGFTLKRIEGKSAFYWEEKIIPKTQEKIYKVYNHKDEELASLKDKDAMMKVFKFYERTTFVEEKEKIFIEYDFLMMLYRHAKISYKRTGCDRYFRTFAKIKKGLDGPYSIIDVFWKYYEPARSYSEVEDQQRKWAKLRKEKQKKELKNE